jgi:hypothetical protein
VAVATATIIWSITLIVVAVTFFCLGVKTTNNTAANTAENDIKSIESIEAEKNPYYQVAVPTPDYYRNINNYIIIPPFASFYRGF